MIYLIEDKVSRRNDYGWTDKKVEEYKDRLCTIDNYDCLCRQKSQILSADNVVLYHESFINKVDNKNCIESFLKNIEDCGMMLAYFSGSKSQRTKDVNICNLPPHVLYANLEYFINMSKTGDTDFKYLMFGQHPELEDKLRKEIISVNKANVGCEKFDTDKNLFFFLASDNTLEPPYKKVAIQESFDFECDDTSLCQVIKDNLEESKYDGIFIPLCFGETLSDFMGLRLAMLTRFSKTQNIHTPIIIYGEADYSDLLDTECFDVLKMPGVYYVHSDYKSLQNITDSISDINDSDYSIGIRNIHLNIPSDIGDNHNISNKWAIHRWAQALNISDEDEFGIIEDKVLNSLYFKYLQAFNTLKKTVVVNPKDLVINHLNNIPEPRILFVDDQADEGWYEILCNVLYDKNGFSFDYVGDELKSKSQDEVLDIITEKIKIFSPNIVILDLRLCSWDTGYKPVKELSGNKILRAIKQMNRGIQVLMFSATSKVWNYQYLLNKEGNLDGADGFIVKERPEDSKDTFFTRTVIKQFISSINEASRFTYRKTIWEKLQEDKIICSSSDSKYSKAVISLLKLAEEALFAKQNNYANATVFMNFFRIIEATANQYINDWPLKDEDGKYCFKLKNGKFLLGFDKKYNIKSLDVLKQDSKSLPYFQKICNTLYHLGTYSENALNVVNKRNAFTHPNMTKQEALEEFCVQDVLNVYDIVHKLIQNQVKL